MISLLQQILPIPSVLDMKSILCIGPHPDDIEIGLGAMLALAKERGIALNFLIVTDGGAGSKDPSISISQLIDKRTLEAKQSAAVYGVERVIFLDLPDGGDYSVHECVERLVQAMLPCSFDAVFCPDPTLPNEIHPDHLKVGQATKEALFLLANPLARKRRNMPGGESEKQVHLGFYFTHQANSFVEIHESHLELQRQAILHHASQYPIQDAATKQLFQYLIIQKQSFGQRINTLYADGFALMSPIQQHCYPEWNHYE